MSQPIRDSLSLHVITYLVLMVSGRVMAALPIYQLTQYCSNTLDLSLAKINSGRLQLRPTQDPSPGPDCHVVIKAPANKLLTFKFQQMDIKSSPGCNSGYVQIFQDVQRQLPITEKLCNSNRPNRAYVTASYESSIEVMIEDFRDKNFELLFTAFRFAPCVGGDYHCNNGHCISQDLYCNGADNCGDGSDMCLLRREAIVGLLVGSAVVVFIVIVVVAVLLIRRQRKIRRERVSG